MLDDFQSRVINTSCPDSSVVLGQSATNTEPVSSRPTDRTKCPAGLRFRKGGEDPVPQEVNIASGSFIDETPETPRHPPGDAGEPQGRHSAPEPGLNHNQMMMIGIPWRIVHPQIRLTSG